MYHEYPYTTYYEDIDKLCKCCKMAKLHLDTHGDYLRLVDDKGNVLSSVKVSFAETALDDVEGRPIKSYIISAGTNGTYVVFTHGDGTLTSFEVPFSQTAAKDVQNKDLLDYVYGVSISGDKVRITNGDGTVYELTIPFATKAATDINGRDLTTYACTLSVDGRELVLSDSVGRELSRITVPYAVKAKEDVDGDDIKSTYGTTLTQGATTVKLLAKDSTVLSEITVNYATTALQDTDGNLFLSDYVEKLVVDADGKRIGVEAHDGTRLATITVPFATLATDASNAIESVQVVGDQIVFTTYAGQTFSITAPYAVKAQKDDLNNTIKSTYFAGVSNDTDAGTITFYDALGQVLATIQNGVITHAIYDDYDNPLAGYIKAIQATAGSDYLTATHGDGTVDSIKVDYSERAWKDTNGNVIKNTYVKTLSIAQDPDDGQWKLFAFNGDTPAALLFALVITAEKAYKDVNGKLLTSYLAHVDLDGNDIISKDGEDNEVDRLTPPYGVNLNLNASNELELLDPDGNVLDSEDMTHLPYGVDLNVNASKELELIDPDGNILDSTALPIPEQKPIMQNREINDFVIAVYQGSDASLSSPIAVRKTDPAPTLAANTSYRLMCGRIVNGDIQYNKTAGQRYFPNPPDWWTAAGEVFAEEADMSYYHIDNILMAQCAAYHSAVELNSSLGGATIDYVQTCIVKLSTEAENTTLDDYLFVDVINITVGASPVTLDWSSDYSTDVKCSNSDFQSNYMGTVRYDWSLN